MPFTKARLQSIMQTRGQAFVPRDKMNYAGRVCETYLRKKLYRWEDRAALAAYKLLKQTTQRIQAYALQTANQLRLTQVANDSNSIVFRRMVGAYTQSEITDYGAAVANLAYTYAYTAFAAGWYGRLWQLDQASHHDPRVKPEPFRPSLAAQTVLQPGLTEAVDNAGAGGAFTDNYTMAAQAAIIKVKRTINATATQPLGVLALTQAISATLGVNAPAKTASKGLYHAVSLPMRTAVMRSANHASAEVYKTHTEMLLGAMWVTSHDSRVCDICASHDGQIYIINSLVGIALFGLPPDGSHYGCRCTIVPLMIPVDKANEPPDDSFDDWLAGLGFADSLGDFMTDNTLESTQL